MSNIPRRDPLVDEGVDILEGHFKRCKFDYAVAFNTLSSVESQFVNDELAKCLYNPRYYLENYHIIKTKQEGFKTLFPFFDSQEIIYAEIMGLLKAGKPAKILIDKARQLGSSTLAQGLIFHKTAFSEAVNTLIVAQDPGQADYLFSMSTLAYENMPWWMKPMVRYKSKGRYLMFDSETPGMAGLNSWIGVEAANKLSGVSVGKTVHCAHLSELSSWDNAQILTEQIFPAMPDNAIAILESTARGRSGFWYNFWVEAVESWGDEDWQWKPIFVEWFRCKEYSIPIENKDSFKLTEEEAAIREKIIRSAHFYIPDEQFNWRRVKRKETIKITGDDTSFLQEYPINWQESFQTSGLCAFPKKKLQELMNTRCTDPLWFGELEYHHGSSQEIQLHLTATFDEKTKQRLPGINIPAAKYYGGRLRVWEWPESGEHYYLGADPAHGIEGGDFSCAQVLRIGRGPEPDVQVAEWRGWINPTPFGHVLVGLAKWYNMAEISLELNAVGEKTNMEIFRILEYPNLFRWKHYDKVKNFYTDLMAWITNHKTRDLIITNMRERIMENTVILYSHDLLDEMLDFSAEEEGERFEGQSTKDDRVMAAMICLWCAHDSDYGKQAAAQPRVDNGRKKYYVIDAKGRICMETDQRELAEREILSDASEPGTYPVWKPGWSISQRSAKQDFANSDFSPVHDRPGPRNRMHYAYGIPAESIRLDNIVDLGMMPTGGDWRDY